MQLYELNHPKKSTAITSQVWKGHENVATPPPPSKIHENWKKNPDRKPPAIMLSCSVSHLIQSGYMESCLAAQKRFYCLKGQGPLKNFKNRRKCFEGLCYVLCYVASIFFTFWSLKIQMEIER